jgi:hypothetical protein
VEINRADQLRSQPLRTGSALQCGTSRTVNRNGDSCGLRGLLISKSIRLVSRSSASAIRSLQNYQPWVSEPNALVGGAAGCRLKECCCFKDVHWNCDFRFDKTLLPRLAQFCGSGLAFIRIHDPINDSNLRFVGQD